jgi:hypothetical protein
MYRQDLGERRRRSLPPEPDVPRMHSAPPTLSPPFRPGSSNAAVARLLTASRRPAMLAREEADDEVDSQDAGRLEDGGGAPIDEPGLPAPDGVAVLEAPADGDLATAGTSDDQLLHRSVLPGRIEPSPRALLQRDVSVDPLGGTLGGAGFLMSLRQADQGSLGMTHVQFRAAGAKKGARQPKDVEYKILLLDSRHSLGTAWAWFTLFLRVDGANILSSYTRLWKSSGYSGGPLGSDASVTFGAIEGSGAEDGVRSVIITCDGTNNPNGPGFQKFFAQFTVKGDGAVTIDKCVKTVGDGWTKTSPTAYAGFTEGWPGNA